MLPDKNKLNDETIEQINGGEGIHASDNTDDSEIKQEWYNFSSDFICPSCGKTFEKDRQRPSGYCSYCDPQTIEKIAPIGGIKTTVPISSDKKKLKKVN